MFPWKSAITETIFSLRLLYCRRPRDISRRSFRRDRSRVAPALTSALISHFLFRPSHVLVRPNVVIAYIHTTSFFPGFYAVVHVFSRVHTSIFILFIPNVCCFSMMYFFLGSSMGNNQPGGFNKRDRPSDGYSGA